MILTLKHDPDHGDSFIRLQRIVAVLRGDHGCPWDIKQTPASLKKYLLEECQELVEAIDSDHADDIREEIGDVFFILTMLAAFFEEQGKFSANEAMEEVIAKMIRRHPHVFADAAVTDEQELRAQWERIKAQEKQSRPHRTLK